MYKKKLKYIKYLEDFPDCPCATKYNEVEMEAYRWVKNNENVNDFIPLSLINDPPPRILDDSDKLCASYGLSMFLTLKHAAKRYQSRIRHTRACHRQKQIEEYGKEIALLNLEINDGVAGDLNSDSGHFTFHQYENVDLKNKITRIFDIFDENGEFITY